MSHAQYLRDLLRPLGVYDLREGTINRGELAAYGVQLDSREAELDGTAREMNLTTAQDFGLEMIEALLPYRPVCETAAQRRAALAALLRIGGDSFTLSAINSAISGCGINALVEEKNQVGYVRVIFPDVVGIPDGIDQIKEIVLDILPTHLDVEFYFRFLTWAECHAHQYSWSIVQGKNYTWYEFQCAI